MIFIIIGIICALIIISVTTLIIKSFIKKINISTIKVNEGVKNIEFLLEKKTEILTKIKEKLKDDLDISIMENLPKIKGKSLDSFEIDAELEILEKELKETIEYNKKIVLDDETNALLNSLEKANIDLKATKNYYNDNCEIYNALIDNFLAKIIAKIKGYSPLDFYETKQEEEFEILKKKNKE